MLRLGRAALFLVVSILAAAPAVAAERFALVIGNQAYNDAVGPLRNPHKDIAVDGFPPSGVLPSSGNFTSGNITANAGLMLLAVQIRGKMAS